MLRAFSEVDHNVSIISDANDEYEVTSNAVIANI